MHDILSPTKSAKNKVDVHFLVVKNAYPERNAPTPQPHHFINLKYEFLKFPPQSSG